MAPTLLLETTHLLIKRGDSDIAGIPKWAWVFLVMLAAGVGIILVYGIFRFMTPEKPAEKSISAEQADYMREVRERGYNRLMAEVVGRKDPYRHRASNRR